MNPNPQHSHDHPGDRALRRGRPIGRRLGRVGLACGIATGTLVGLASASVEAASVAVTDGTLTIEGDASSEDITVSALGVGSYLVEIGLEPSHVVHDVVAIEIRTRGGDDRVRLFDVNLAGGMTVDLGGGANGFEIDNSEIDGELVVVAGRGDDHALISRTVVEGRTKVDLRDGDDVVAVLGGEFDDFVSRAGRDGTNQFTVQSSPLFHGTTVVRGGGDDDRIDLGFGRFEGPTKVVAGGGDDLVEAGRRSEFEDLRVNGGAGRDIVRLDDSGATGSTKVVGGRGNDHVIVINGSFGDLTFHAGSGDDEFEINDASIDGSVEARMSSGADRARLVGDGISRGSVVLRGGSGIDTIDASDWRFTLAPTVASFETVVAG